MITICLFLLRKKNNGFNGYLARSIRVSMLSQFKSKIYLTLITMCLVIMYLFLFQTLKLTQYQYHNPYMYSSV